MADDRTIRVRLLAEIDSYLDGMRKAGEATADFGKQVSGRGTAVKADMEKVGRAALVMSGGMAIAMGAAVKSAMDWESAFAGVEKTFDTTGLEAGEAAAALGEMEDGLRDLAKELPASHKEIAAVAEAAGQLGIKRDAVLAFTETMIALGETTNLTADEAATSIAQFMNVMRTAPGDVDNLSSALVDLGNNGASTERDIIEIAQRLSGAGRMIGASEQDILALSSAMADLGIQAQLGGGAMSRQLRKINSAVLANGDGLEKWAHIANVSAKEFGDVWRRSPAEAMDLVAKGLGRVRDAGGDVAAALEEVGVKGTQDLDVLGRLAGAGDRISTSLGISNEAWEKNVALQEEAAKRYGTTESQMQITKNKINDLGIELGDRLLPVVSFVVDKVGALADVFSNLPAGAQIGITALGGVATAGLGIIGMVGILGPKVRELDKALETMGLGAGFASRNLGRLAKISAVGGGLIIGLQAVGAALDGAFDKDHGGNIEVVKNALIRLGQGAAIETAGLNVDNLADAIERIAAPSNATKASNAIEGFFTTVTGSEAFNDLEAARERVDGLDKALADLAQIDPALTSAALEAIKTALGPEDFDRLLPLLDDYEVSLVALDNAGATGAAGIGEVTNAAGVSEEAISDLADEIDALFSSLFGVEAAADAFQQGLNDLDETVATAIEQGLNLNDVLGDQSDGALTLRGHMRDLVTEASELIEEWIEQGTTGAELRDRISEISTQFRDQAAAAGVPQPAIDHYLQLLADIPASIETTFGIDVEPAEVALARIGERLEAFGIDPAKSGAYYKPPGTQGPVLKLPQGPVPRAGGGPVWTGQKFMVGERGPEVVEFGAPGYVHNAAATRAMTDGSSYPMSPMPQGGAAPSTNINVNLNVAGSVHSKESLKREVVSAVREAANTKGGGDVQRAFGRQ